MNYSGFICSSKVYLNNAFHTNFEGMFRQLYDYAILLNNTFDKNKTISFTV